MNNQLWRDSPGANGGSKKGDYDVQSTYIAPQPQYEDPFAPATGSAFASPPAESSSDQVPSAVPEASGSKNVHAAAGPSDHTVLQFHESNIPSHDVQGKMGGANTPSSSPEVPPVQAGYSAATRLLGGFLNSSSGGGGPGDDNENEANLNKAAGFFSLRRYRKHFNVDTMDVLGRMLDSVIGFARPNFFEKTAENADLYGPFWVATTLVFVSAVTGNYASYVSYKHHHSGSQTAMDSWYYDVDKVGYSAILFYGYVGIIGFLMFAALRWGFKSDTTLVQTWCAYGYSLSIFIPMSFACIFPIEALRWSLVGAATLTSGLFLLVNFKKPIFAVAGAKCCVNCCRALPMWLAMGILHIALGLALKLYFFRYSSTK